MWNIYYLNYKSKLKISCISHFVTSMLKTIMSMINVVSEFPIKTVESLMRLMCRFHGVNYACVLDENIFSI